MSDLPDEIVERVAKVLGGEIKAQSFYSFSTEEGKFLYCSDSNVTLDANALARAALVASGWAEMKEALEKIADMKAQDSMRQECCGQAVIETNRFGEAIGQDCCGNPDILGAWNDIASAALSKARGEA